jgi:hypothetical protein
MQTVSDVSMPEHLIPPFCLSHCAWQGCRCSLVLTRRGDSRPDFTARMQVLVYTVTVPISRSQSAPKRALPLRSLQTREDLRPVTTCSEPCRRICHNPELCHPGTDLVTTTVMQLDLFTVSGVTRVAFERLSYGLNIYRVWQLHWRCTDGYQRQCHHALSAECLPVSDIRVLRGVIFMGRPIHLCR